MIDEDDGELLEWVHLEGDDHTATYQGETVSVSEVGNGVVFVQMTPSGANLEDTKLLAQRMVDTVLRHRAGWANDIARYDMVPTGYDLRQSMVPDDTGEYVLWDDVVRFLRPKMELTR